MLYIVYLLSPSIYLVINLFSRHIYFLLTASLVMLNVLSVLAPLRRIDMELFIHKQALCFSPACNNEVLYNNRLYCMMRTNKPKTLNIWKHWESQHLEALVFLTQIFIPLKWKVKEHYPAQHFNGFVTSFGPIEVRPHSCPQPQQQIPLDLTQLICTLSGPSAKACDDGQTWNLDALCALLPFSGFTLLDTP